MPSDALTSLPFHLLVTRAPEAPIESFADYRNVAWLARERAISVLPSVAALRALRVVAKTASAPKPFVGYGNPVFGQDKRRRRGGERRARLLPPISAGPVSIWRRCGAACPRLPETADELKSVARLGAPASEIISAAPPTVAAVKQARLDHYRIVYFATHGLVAGDVKGLAEPALALSLPPAAAETACSPPARWRSSSSMPTWSCFRRATR